METYTALFEQRLLLDRFPHRRASFCFVQVPRKPCLNDALCFGDIVFENRSALSPKVEAISVDLQKKNLIDLAGEFFVEKEDARLHAGIRIEDTGWQRDDGDERILHEKFSQLHVRILRCGDDAVGHDDTAASIRRKMFSDVIGEEYF